MSQLAERSTTETEDDAGQFNLEPKTARELFIVLNGQNTILRNDIAHVKDDIVQVNRRIDDMHTQVDQRLNDINRRIDDMHAQVNQRFDDVNQRFDDVNHRLNDVNQRFADMSKQISEVKGTLRWLVGIAMAAIVTPIILRLLGS